MATVNSPQAQAPWTHPTQITPPEGPHAQRLIAFLDPHVSAPGFENLRLEEILSWDDEQLESREGYLQWLFPVAFQSGFLDQQTLIYARSRNEILQNMRASLTRMMAFYGFDVSWDQNDDSKLRLSFTQTNPEPMSRWLKAEDHNHAHIMGIIWSLRLFSLTEEAQRVYEAFMFANEVFGSPVGEASLTMWRHAFINPLCVLSQGLLNFQPRFYSLKLNGGSLTPQGPQNLQN